MTESPAYAEDVLTFKVRTYVDVVFSDDPTTRRSMVCISSPNVPGLHLCGASLEELFGVTGRVMAQLSRDNLRRDL